MIVTTVVIGNFKAIPIYRATTQLIIEKERSNVKTNEGVLIDDVSLDYYQTQYKIIKSRTLAKKVIEKLKLNEKQEFSSDPKKNNDIVSIFLTKISVEPIRETRLLKLSADSISPELATEIVNTLADEYIEQNLSNKLFASREILKKLPKNISKDLDSSNDYSVYETLPSVVNNLFIQELKKKYILLQSEYANLSKKYKDKHPDIIRLKAEIEQLNQSIKKEIKNIVISVKIELSGDMSSNNIRIIDVAEVPTEPISPKKKINIIIACIIGLVLGISFAFFIDSLDNTVKTSQDIEDEIKLPFLGILPKIKQNKKKSGIIDEQNNPALEALKFIRTSFVFLKPIEQLKIVAVTSAVPNEGKSFTSLNLAVILSKLNEKVLIVDCDLRRCGLTKSLNMSTKTGLTDYLIKDCKIDDIIQKTDFLNLHIVPSGPRPPLPGNLLTLTKLKEFFDSVATKYDRIIIDSCPILPVSDTMDIVKFTDGIVVVVAHAQTNKKMLFTTKKKIESVGGEIVGVILNKTNLDGIHADEYSYQYKYEYK
jgi:capsular exopolysaccharide synthesis family protein